MKVLQEHQPYCVDSFPILQVVHPESQENGQKEAKRSRHEEEDEQQADEEREREKEEKMDATFTGTTDTQSPSETSHDAEINTGNRSITSQSSSGKTFYFLLNVC